MCGVISGAAGWQLFRAFCVGVLLAAGMFGWVHPGVVTTIRQARPEDEPELRNVDAAMWAAGVSPGPPPSTGAAFFGGRIAPADVLVAETGRVIAGFASLGQSGQWGPEVGRRF